MTQAINLPEKESYLLVEFAFGDPSDYDYARYTDNNFDSGLFLSQPDMAVKLPENTGTFGEAECRIDLPLDDFTEPVSGTAEHSPVFVTVTEVNRGLTGGPSASNLVLFKGRCVRAIRNAEGRADSVRILCEPIKARLDKASGLPANHHCVFTLFGRGCGLNVATYQHVCQIATISGKVITISSPNVPVLTPTSPGGDISRHWERGYMEKDGLRISIAQWVSTTPTEFVLRSRPPNSWLLAGSSSIRIVPGCHKRAVEDCIGQWNNEQGFCGFGFAIPAYNPIFEDPQ